jgi:hypothetical protein
MQTDAVGESSGLPMSFFVLSGAAAIVAGASIPGAPPGVNFAATGAPVLAAAWAARRKTLVNSDHVLIAIGTVMLIFSAVRSAGWVLALDLVCFVVIVSVAMARARGWAEVLMSPPRTLRTLPRGTAIVLGPAAKKAAHDVRLTPVLRTGTMMALAVAVFGGLFASADPAFASLADDFLLPSLDLSLLPARAATAIGVVALAGSLTLQSVRSAATTVPNYSERRLKLGGAEWKATLILIDLLFAGFVAVQLAVLFGGHDHVLGTTGLTYAEYARQGFSQLMAASVLTLGVVAAAVMVPRTGRADRAWLRVLLGILCVLTLVILASASKRMNLYQEAYGFTRLRLLADLAILMLGGTFLMLLVAGTMWKGAWLPRAIVILGAAAVIGFNFYNPDARIAEKNVHRFLRTAQIDLDYLAGLSPDAVPELMALPEPERGCALVRLGEQLAERAAPWSWNLARDRARVLLRESFPEGVRCSGDE